MEVITCDLGGKLFREERNAGLDLALGGRNQGLLSIIGVALSLGALVAALVIALIENRRANLAEARAARSVRDGERRRVSSFVDTIDGLIAEVEKSASKGATEVERETTMAITPQAYIDDCSQAAGLLDLILPTAPPDAEMLLQTRRLSDRLKAPVGWTGITAGTKKAAIIRGHAKDVRERVDKLRSREKELNR